MDDLCPSLSSSYVIGTLPGEPGVRHLLRVNDLSADTDSTTCLTCPEEKANSTAVSDGSGDVSEEEDELYYCGFNDAEISPGSGFYVQKCLGPGLPFTRVFSLPDNRPVAVLDANEETREAVGKVALPK